MNVRLFGRPGLARVNHDQLRWISTAPPIKDARPEDGLRGGHIMPGEEETIRLIDIGIRAGLAVRAERLLQGLRGGRCAEARVPIHVVRTEAGMTDHRKRVVLFKKELPGVIDADGPTGVLLLS